MASFEFTWHCAYVRVHLRRCAPVANQSLVFVLTGQNAVVHSPQTEPTLIGLACSHRSLDWKGAKDVNGTRTDVFE